MSFELSELVGCWSGSPVGHDEVCQLLVDAAFNGSFTRTWDDSESGQEIQTYRFESDELTQHDELYMFDCYEERRVTKIKLVLNPVRSMSRLLIGCMYMFQDGCMVFCMQIQLTSTQDELENAQRPPPQYYRFDASITYELVDCSYCSAQDTGLTILMISEKSEPEKGFTLVQDNDANSPSYGEILFDDAQKVAEEQAAQFVILLTQFKIQHKDDQDISAVLDNFIRDLSQ